MSDEKTNNNQSTAPDTSPGVVGTGQTDPANPASPGYQGPTPGQSLQGADPSKSSQGGAIATLTRFLTGSGLGPQERYDMLAKELNTLGLTIQPKGPGSGGVPLVPNPQIKPDPAVTSPPHMAQTGIPGPVSGASSQIQGGLYKAPAGFASGGIQTQSKSRLSYNGKLPMVGTDRFDAKDEKALRDFSKNLNRHLPLESILDRFVDFLSSPNPDGKVKHFTTAEIKQKLGCLLPESALVSYDALVRDPGADLNAMFYTLGTRYGAYKKIDRIRENIELIIDDMSTPVMNVLESLESQYNSIVDIPISKVQEEAIYMAMRFLKRRLGAGFAQSVKIAKLSYNVQSLRDLILLISEEFAAIIKEGEDKDVQTKAEKLRFHQILASADDLTNTVSGLKSHMDNFLNAVPLTHHCNAIGTGITNNIPQPYANQQPQQQHQFTRPNNQQQTPIYQPLANQQQQQRQQFRNNNANNNFSRPQPPANLQYKNQPCSVPAHVAHTNGECQHQKATECNYAPNHANHSAADCRRTRDHTFGLTKNGGARFQPNTQTQQQPQQPRGANFQGQGQGKKN